MIVLLYLFYRVLEPENKKKDDKMFNRKIDDLIEQLIKIQNRKSVTSPTDYQQDWIDAFEETLDEFLVFDVEALLLAIDGKESEDSKEEEGH